jgi:DtxR family transcriptional regulator, Mn-dependent transcriptional regulator
VLSRSRQDYLKSLYALAPEGGAVTTSALAARLNVSAPSVTNMLGKLARERLVAYVPRAGARLTAAGRAQALALLRRHRILETFLVRVLGLDWAEVHDDAEVLEHHVSERVLAAIDRLVGHPAEDPHGHAIPDAHGRMPHRELVPLGVIEAGGRATVREIHDADGSRMARWKQAGIVPGAKLKVREVRPGDDIVELEIEGRTHVAGRGALEGVMVDRPRRRRHA